jgi:hypothetical protein
MSRCLLGYYPRPLEMYVVRIELESARILFWPRTVFKATTADADPDETSVALTRRADVFAFLPLGEGSAPVIARTTGTALTGAADQRGPLSLAGPANAETVRREYLAEHRGKRIDRICSDTDGRSLRVECPR